MGISGFLPLLKSIHESVHLSSFAGKTVAVDGNVWMHRGAFTCAVDLATNVSTTKYVDYFMRQVEMLLCYKIIPLIVFDGEPLPIKACTNDERRRRREEALEKGRLLMQQGNKKEAYEYFCKSVQVTRDMVKQVIAALEARNIQNVVAPYEADPQLAYLMKTKKADAVITEDSDLLVFGCDCVIFKLNKYGEGVQIRLSNLNRLKEMKLGDWDATKIRHMCILSGCDYLPSLPGVGLKTAYQLLKTYKSADQVIKVLRSQGKMKKIPHYQEAFHRADQAFMYPFVFDLDLQQVVRLNPLESKDITLDFLGAHPSNVKLPTSTPPLPCNDVSDANKENIPPWMREACQPVKQLNAATLSDLFTKSSQRAKTKDSLKQTNVLSYFAKQKQTTTKTLSKESSPITTVTTTTVTTSTTTEMKTKATTATMTTAATTATTASATCVKKTSTDLPSAQPPCKVSEETISAILSDEDTDNLFEAATEIAADELLKKCQSMRESLLALDTHRVPAQDIRIDEQTVAIKLIPHDPPISKPTPTVTTSFLGKHKVSSPHFPVKRRFTLGDATNRLCL